MAAPGGRCSVGGATASTSAAARGAEPEHLAGWSSGHHAETRRHQDTYGYGEVGRFGERSTSRVISLGAKTRNGGPQKPVPRLV